MSSLEYHNSAVSLEVHYSNGALMLTDQTMREFVTHLMKFALHVGLARLSLEEQPVGSCRFTYHFEDKTGREWNQELVIEDDDPLMNFAVVDHWRLSEFTTQRPVRDEAIVLVRRFGVSKISAVFP